MKNTSFLLIAALFCAAPLAAQEVEETAVAETQSAASELAQKATSALINSQWQSKFAIAMTADGDEEASTNITIDIRLQDVTHFAIEAAVTAEDPFEGEVTQNFTIMCDGEFVYVNSPSLSEMSGGMINGPIKVQVKALMAIAGLDELPTSDFFASMVDGLLSEIPLTENGSTEALRRYSVSHEEEGSIVACFYGDTFLPASMEMASDGQIMTVTASDSSLVEEFAEGAFTFVPADGVVVTDMTAMIQMQMGGPPAPADDDLEF
ncbi:MAG: outer membrane lipoprotein-sorting protein [Myxococcota bacterium]|jgi:outer membrane lipoprotein-sorting protein